MPSPKKPKIIKAWMIMDGKRPSHSIERFGQLEIYTTKRAAHQDMEVGDVEVKRVSITIL